LIDSGPSVGLNVTFKNRSDISTHPTAPMGFGTYWNQKAWAVFVSSQPRPSGSGAEWATAGSGWNIVRKVGDSGFGSGLDWEGGDSGLTGVPATIRNFSVIDDFTDMADPVHGSGRDMAGGLPWIWAFRTGATYFLMRFNPQITTGEIEIMNDTPAVAGDGYAVDDTFTLDHDILSGTSATAKVTSISGMGGTGPVTGVQLLTGGDGYYVRPSCATTATSGAGTGLRVQVMQVVGERFEFFRSTDPADPYGTGNRQCCIDMAYNPLTDQGGALVRAFP
jgi:hypothetical protein